LNKPEKDGISKREHYKQVEKQIGQQLEETRNPYEFPQLLTHVWSAFVMLSSARGAGFSGPNPITFHEIQSYCDLTGDIISPLDVIALKRLDAEYVRIANG